MESGRPSPLVVEIEATVRELSFKEAQGEQLVGGERDAIERLRDRECRRVRHGYDRFVSSNVKLIWSEWWHRAPESWFASLVACCSVLNSLDFEKRLSFVERMNSAQLAA